MREEEKMRKIQEEGDKAYWDLNSLMMDQEGQV